MFAILILHYLAHKPRYKSLLCRVRKLSIDYRGHRAKPNNYWKTWNAVKNHAQRILICLLSGRDSITFTALVGAQSCSLNDVIARVVMTMTNVMPGQHMLMEMECLKTPNWWTWYVIVRLKLKPETGLLEIAGLQWEGESEIIVNSKGVFWYI